MRRAAHARAGQLRRAGVVRNRGGVITKLVVLLAVVVLFAGLYLLRRPILRWCGGFWVVDEAPQASDAIFLLGDDNYLAERAGRAAELYHARWAPLIVASGRWLRPYANIAELMEHDLVGKGVARNSIVRFPTGAANTFEEALFLRRLSRERRWKRILVVTSNYHTRRARYIFREVMGQEAEVRVVAARDSSYDPRSWWQTRPGVKIFFRELAAFVVALWEVDRDAPLPAASP